MLPLYQRYISAQIGWLLVICTFVITSFVWIIQVLQFMYLINAGTRLMTFLKVMLYVLPSLLLLVLPICTALSVIYNYNAMREDRQIVVLKSAGLSNFDLAKPAFLIASVVTIFAFYTSFSLLPESYSALKHHINFIKNNYASNIVNPKTFTQVANSVTVYADKKLISGEMQDVIIFDDRDKSQGLVLLFAKSGSIIMMDNKSLFELREGTRQAYDANGHITRLNFGSFTVELTKNKPDNTGHVKSYLNEYYISELLQIGSRAADAKKNKMLVEAHHRILWPFYNFLMVFVGLAFFLKQRYNRRSNAKAIILTAILLSAVAYIHFGLQNLIAKDLVWLPLLYINFFIAAGIGVWCYTKHRV